MKNITFTALILITLASCQSNAGKQALMDSLGTDTIPNTAKQYPDSLQKKVVGDIRFGIDSNEFVKLSKAFLKAHQSGKRYKLGNFEFIRIDPEFYNGKLYKVTLYNPFVEYNVEDITNGAVDLVKAQYGAADSAANSDSVPAGYERKLDVWKIGIKNISIILSNNTTLYTVELVFTDTSTANHIQANSLLKKDSITKSAKKDL